MKTYYKIIDWFWGLFITPTLEQKAKRFAIRAHRSTNHKYDGKPYSVHLKMVVEYAIKYIHLIPEDKRAILIAACWLHDTIEDCRVTYNDIKKIFGKEIAKIVYALSNEKGKTRAERANPKYYKGIRDTELASYAKTCDRLGNSKYYQMKGSDMLDKYRKEAFKFEIELYRPEYAVMFDELNEILGI